MLKNDYGNWFVIANHLNDWTGTEDLANNAFDCLVFNTELRLPLVEIDRVAFRLAKSVSDWVEVFGHDAERLHDAIDNAAVAMGRQSRVGDRDPMTSWQDDLMTEREFAAYAWSGGQGTSEYKLILVIGSTDATRQMNAEFQLLSRTSQ